MNYELHPLCTMFPRLEGGEFDELCADIKANGLRQAIMIHQGMILDGGNRYRACLASGVSPKFSQFNGDDVVGFVLSANLHRRHMSAGQRAVIVSLATNWTKSQTHGGNRQEEALPLETVSQRAARSGATVRTQAEADRLAKKDPKKTQEVAQGKVSLYQAAKESKPAAEVPKILPRRDAASNVAGSEPDALGKAREHAKKQNAAIRELLFTLAARDAEIESLKGQLAEAQDNARELADSLEAMMKAAEGEPESAKEIKRLFGQLRVVETQRDTYLTQCSEMKKSLASMRRKLDKQA